MISDAIILAFGLFGSMFLLGFVTVALAIQGAK